MNKHIFYLVLASNTLLIVLSAGLQSCGDDSSESVMVEANFSTDVTTILVGESVKFTDSSTGDPTQWEWTFEGGTPATSTEQNPVVVYNSSGTYDVTLKVSNSTSEDSKKVTDYILVECECSPSCPESCKESLLTNQFVEVSGVNRSYDIFLPSSHDISDPLPVVIDLHGYTSSGSEQREISNFTSLAEENDFIVVWPEALVSGASCVVQGVSGKFWNADWGGDIDDVSFINALLDNMISAYNVDSKRIYVSGLSNGGFMVYSLACELSDRLAAVASVAGTMTTNMLNNDCQPVRALPVLHVHGTSDVVIPYNGKGECLGGLSAVTDVVDFWRVNAGCNTESTTVTYEDIDTSDNSTARMLTYDGCDNKVSFLIVDDGGHNWPGSSYQMNQGFSILLPINNDINASELIWEFFQRHQLP